MLNEIDGKTTIEIIIAHACFGEDTELVNQVHLFAHERSVAVEHNTLNKPSRCEIDDF